MAGNHFTASPVTVEQQEHPHGHDICYTFLLCNAGALRKEWTFTKNYRPPCEIFKTSWKFEMTLERHPKCFSVFGSAKLERNDSIDTAFGVFLEVKISHDGMFKDYSPFPAVSKEMRPGEEIKVKIPDIVPDPYYFALIHQDLTVAISISVLNCHRDVGKGLDTPCGESEREIMDCSKK